MNGNGKLSGIYRAIIGFLAGVSVLLIAYIFVNFSGKVDAKDNLQDSNIAVMQADISTIKGQNVMILNMLNDMRGTKLDQKSEPKK